MYNLSKNIKYEVPKKIQKWINFENWFKFWKKDNTY